MKKLLYTAFVALLTAWSLFFISEQRLEPVSTSEVHAFRDAIMERSHQEQAQIDAINDVTGAVVGVINLWNNQERGEGSGVVYHVEDGNTYIVTNEHVIAGATEVEVVFPNGSRFLTEVVGMDIFTDLAVLRVPNYEAEHVARFGRTEDLAIGQTVIAIGNPLGLNFAGSATMGIVSGHGRTVPVTIGTAAERNLQQWEMVVLQTDAAINRGNSGGALINLDGEVIGINSMKVAGSDIDGMSFSIPTYVALPVLEDLKAYGEVIRPTLGVYIRPLHEISLFDRTAQNISQELSSGILIEGIVSNSMAETMGLLAGDVVISMGETAVSNIMSFRQALFTYRAGDEMTLTVIRDGEELKLSVVVEIGN